MAFYAAINLSPPETPGTRSLGVLIDVSSPVAVQAAMCTTVRWALSPPGSG